MSDWQKGDLALCVKGGPIPCPREDAVHRGEYFKGGEVRTVESLKLCAWDRGKVGHKCGCLELSFTDGSHGIVSRFRKITPDSSDEFDREIIDLMAGKRVPA